MSAPSPPAGAAAPDAAPPPESFYCYVCEATVSLPASAAPPSPSLLLCPRCRGDFLEENPSLLSAPSPPPAPPGFFSDSSSSDLSDDADDIDDIDLGMDPAAARAYLSRLVHHRLYDGRIDVAAAAAGSRPRRPRPSPRCPRSRCPSPPRSAPSARRTCPSPPPPGNCPAPTSTTPAASSHGWRCTTPAPSAASASPPPNPRWRRRRSRIRRPRGSLSGSLPPAAAALAPTMMRLLRFQSCYLQTQLQSRRRLLSSRRLLPGKEAVDLPIAVRLCHPSGHRILSPIQSCQRPARGMAFLIEPEFGIIR